MSMPYPAYDPKRKQRKKPSAKMTAASRMNYALFVVRGMRSQVSKVQMTLSEVLGMIRRNEIDDDAKDLINYLLSISTRLEPTLRDMDNHIVTHNAKLPNHKKPLEQTS